MHPQIGKLADKVLNTSLLPIFIFTLLLSCQSIFGPSLEEQKTQDIVRTQKSLIISFLNKGLPKMALEELKKLRKAHPHDPDFFNISGLAFLAIKAPIKATDYFKKAYKIDQKIPFLLNLSSAYIEANNQRAAMQTLKRLIKHPDFSQYDYPERVYHNLGLANEKINRKKIAVKFYKKALKANPTFYISIMRLGQVYQKIGKLKLAKIYFKKAQILCKACYGPISALSSIYISQNKIRTAMNLLKSFMRNKKVQKNDRLRAKKLLKAANRIGSARKKSHKM